MGKLRMDRTGAIIAVLASFLGVAAAGSPEDPSLAVPLIVTETPLREVQTTDHPLPSTGADRFRNSRLIRLDPDGRRKVLSEGFRAACDPSVSFDGRRLLFAAKVSLGEPWQIWEMNVDGSNARRVLSSGFDCRGPLYVSSLFTLNSPEPWYTLLFVARESHLNESGTGPASSLFSVRLDGRELRRVTANPSRDLDPFQMQDSRVVYAGRRFPRAAAGDPGRMGLFGINIDGTDLEFLGGRQGRRFQRMPCGTEGGLIVFVESDRLTSDGSGQLAALTQQRPHHSYRPLTSDVRYRYLYPSPLKGNVVLVSRREADSSSPYELYLFDADTRRLDPVYTRDGYHCLQARAITPRPEPDGRSTVVNMDYNTGLFYALDCYTSGDPERARLAPGTIARLRVIEGVPTIPATPPISGEPALRRRLLGEVPVEADGSFNIEVPADIPVALQTVDSEGMALATCGWIWVKQRERRGCIGCHEDPESTPENLFVKAVQRRSIKLTLPPNSRRSVGFQEDVFPILRKSCATADCHAGADTPLALPATDNSDLEMALRVMYQTLVPPRESRDTEDGGVNSPAPPAHPKRVKYVHPGRARTSPLVWRLLGRPTARPWDEQPDLPPDRQIDKMPPADSEPLTNREIRTVIEWIDLGAPPRRTPSGLDEMETPTERTANAG